MNFKPQLQCHEEMHMDWRALPSQNASSGTENAVKVRNESLR